MTVLRLVLATVVILIASGCQPAAKDPVDDPVVAVSISDDELRQQLDEVLEDTFSHRRLSLEEHAAWQILHGALAYQREFLVEREGKLVPAVDYLLDGGKMTGWTTEVGVQFEDGGRGLRAVLESGSRTGQGHADQWLAVLAQCGLPANQEIRVDGRTHTMSDFVSQVQWDVPRNVQREYSWTLIGLTSYLPTDASWSAIDGQVWNVERLMEIELEQELSTSACGGTHRLIGVTMALLHHIDQGGDVSGIWAAADERIRAAIEDARRLQNPDGSFSTHYFERPGNSPDLAQQLGTSGHVLEFLTLAMRDEELQQDWVKRAVVHLCGLFRSTRDLPLECGKLYHAAHGLVLYRERTFGARSYAEADVDTEA